MLTEISAKEQDDKYRKPDRLIEGGHWDEIQQSEHQLVCKIDDAYPTLTRVRSFYEKKRRRAEIHS